MSLELGTSERRACKVLGQPRSTQRYRPRVAGDEERLVKRLVELATQYGRYGYRRITCASRKAQPPCPAPPPVLAAVLEVSPTTTPGIWPRFK